MKTSIDLLKNKFELEMKGKIKAFYIGDPWQIPASSLPCLMIAPDNTESDIADNARDIHTHNIVVSFIIDARQYLNATPGEMVGTTFLMETMGSESSSGTPGDATILGVIRDNLNLDTNRFIKNISSVDYTTRRRTEELITLEVTAHIAVEQYVIR